MKVDQALIIKGYEITGIVLVATAGVLLLFGQPVVALLTFALALNLGVSRQTIQRIQNEANKKISAALNQPLDDEEKTVFALKKNPDYDAVDRLSHQAAQVAIFQTFADHGWSVEDVNKEVGRRFEEYRKK